MSLAILYSRAQTGIKAPEVTVEVHLANGLPALSIVGLPEMAVRESKDRVRGALLNARFEFPARRITINLAPADLPKEGGRFDLAIALGILAASGQIPAESLQHHEFLGELALSGSLRPIRGVLPSVVAATRKGRSVIVPRDNAEEASLAEQATVLPASHLLEVCAHLNGSSLISPHRPGNTDRSLMEGPDLGEIRGQSHAKRALTIAAAGGHSLLMLGPPGSGKSMLAARLPGLLPPMTEQEALESATLLSISSQGYHPADWKRRPFRAPHHTASAVALVGGGSNPRPGEISLAHNGVMFLDELPEFERKVLEVLREPLENGHVTISRAARQAEFPARFQLVAAMNPCPCGYLGDNGPKSCRCTQDQVARYQSRISGPLLDRIDMHLQVPRLDPEELIGERKQHPRETPAIREQVARCRELQLERNDGTINARLAGQQLEALCSLDTPGRELLQRAMLKLGLSARAYHRILRLARTIADLAQKPGIGVEHISEAIGYRQMDRSP
jgi:magnesium chelatase family protein